MGPKRKMTTRRVGGPLAEVNANTESDSSEDPVSDALTDEFPASPTTLSIKRLVLTDTSTVTSSEEDDDESSNEDSLPVRPVSVLAPVRKVKTMAINGPSTTTPAASLAPKLAKKTYKVMIAEAITAIGDKQGSSYQPIEKWILVNYPDSANSRTKVSIKRAVTTGLNEGIFIHTTDNSNWMGRLKCVAPVAKPNRRKPNLKPKPKKPAANPMVVAQVAPDEEDAKKNDIKKPSRMEKENVIAPRIGSRPKVKTGGKKTLVPAVHEDEDEDEEELPQPLPSKKVVAKRTMPSNTKGKK